MQETSRRCEGAQWARGGKEGTPYLILTGEKEHSQRTQQGSSAGPWASHPIPVISRDRHGRLIRAQRSPPGSRQGKKALAQRLPTTKGTPVAEGREPTTRPKPPAPTEKVPPQPQAVAPLRPRSPPALRRGTPSPAPHRRRGQAVHGAAGAGAALRKPPPWGPARPGPPRPFAPPRARAPPGSLGQGRGAAGGGCARARGWAGGRSRGTPGRAPPRWRERARVRRAASRAAGRFPPSAAAATPLPLPSPSPSPPVPLLVQRCRRLPGTQVPGLTPPPLPDPPRRPAGCPPPPPAARSLPLRRPGPWSGGAGPRAAPRGAGPPPPPPVRGLLRGDPPRGSPGLRAGAASFVSPGLCLKRARAELPGAPPRRRSWRPSRGALSGRALAGSRRSRGSPARPLRATAFHVRQERAVFPLRLPRNFGFRLSPTFLGHFSSLP